MQWIKIPQQDFALKMEGGGGGLCMRGGIFVGHYGIDNHHMRVFRAVQLQLHCWRGHTR